MNRNATEALWFNTGTQRLVNVFQHLVVHFALSLGNLLFFGGLCLCSLTQLVCVMEAGTRVDLPPLFGAVGAVNHMLQDSSSICSNQTSLQAAAVAGQADDAVAG